MQSYKVQASFHAEVIRVRDMAQGQIARIESVEGCSDGLRHMLGEIIVCNVMGWFTVGTDRYWPSDYAASKDKDNTYRHVSYVPRFLVRPLASGESITITAE